jgi:hypothetical protein
MTDQLYPTADESNHVLCPELYGILRANFPGGVIIANQGEACFTSTHTRTDGSHFTSINHSGEYYRVNCPFCRDTRHRLWVNHMFGQPDTDGRPMRFLATCYNEGCLSNPANRDQFNNVVYGYRNANVRRLAAFQVYQGEWIDPSQLRAVELPGQMIPVSQLARAMPNHEAVQYLCGARRYTTQMLDKYEIQYCTYAPRFPEAAGRIIFPIRYEQQLIGWQARYIGTADWRVIPKYYGMPGMRKRVILYNYDIAKNMPFVCVVEGVTDCHVLGDAGVAILGKSLSRYQAELLVNTWGSKPIMLIFDPDARDEMRSTVADLRECGAIVLEIVLPGEHDCGDYDPRTLWNIIYAQAAASGIVLPRVA